MNFEIYFIAPFGKQLKRLNKKYPSLHNDYSAFLAELKVNPQMGTPLGNNCFKIRMAIASKGKGKSGGARVITHVKVIQHSVYLLSIYDKSEAENIDDRYLSDLLKLIP